MGLFFRHAHCRAAAPVSRNRIAALLCALILLIGLTGCETIGYYSQAAGGQMQLVYKRQNVDDLLEEMRGRERDASEQALFEQLQLSQQILDFARTQLQLEVGKRYRSYVELSQPSVVWNLFAAPALSLEPKTWCYPFVGCAPYRGYFALEDAQRYQQKLETEGFETYLGGVAAYSTLGWFDDPLLSSFVHWPAANLANLLFHELAHSRVWVKDDVAFNEAFASFVGRQGMRQWLLQRGEIDQFQTYIDRQAARKRFLDLLAQTRAALQSVFTSELADHLKAERKDVILAAARSCFATNQHSYGGDAFTATLAGLNNALLVSIATYDDQVPGFAALFAQADEDWVTFYDAVETLAELDPQDREERLRALRESQETDNADDHSAEQVECDALTSHGFDTHPAGAEDDDVGRGRHG